MKILIAIPKYNLSRDVDYSYNFPLGLSYISSILKNNGHEVDCINLNHYYGTVEELITKALNKKKYDGKIIIECKNLEEGINSFKKLNKKLYKDNKILTIVKK